MSGPLSHNMRIAARVLDAIRDAGIDPETDEDAGELLASECDLPDRLLRMIRVARREEAEAEGIDGVLKELAARKARRKAKAGHLRNIVRDAMADLNLTKLPGPDITLSLGKGQVPVLIADEDALPDYLCRFTMRPDILIPKQVAERWGCSEKHVRNMVNRGDLGHFRLGGKLLRIPLSAVEEAECAQKIPATNTDASSPSGSRRASASSHSGATRSDAATASGPMTRLRLASLRPVSTQKP